MLPSFRIMTVSYTHLGFFDAILMDIRMPVMDGLEATRRVRRSAHADAHTVPVIALTANAFDEDMKKSAESGMNGHLAKPIQVEQMCIRDSSGNITDAFHNICRLRPGVHPLLSLIHI